MSIMEMVDISIMEMVGYFAVGFVIGWLLVDILWKLRK